MDLHKSLYQSYSEQILQSVAENQFKITSLTSEYK